MPRPSKTPEQKAEMRKHIREAFSRVAKKLNIAPGDVYGYRQITIRDIIEEAGISIGTFYKYFENRDDLGQSLWLEPVEELRSEMQHDFDRAANPKEQIEGLLLHYVQFSVKNPRIFRAAFLFIRPEGHPQRESLELQDEIFYKNLCAAFEAGQADGSFHTFDNHQMAQTFWAAIHGALALPENLDRYRFDSTETIAGNMMNALMSLIMK